MSLPRLSSSSQPMIIRVAITLLLWIVPLHCFVLFQRVGYRHAIGNKGPLRCIASPQRSSCRTIMTSGVVEEKLKQLGITLPDVSPPAGSYVLCRRSANILYLSGHLPKALDGSLTTGKVGADVDVEKAAEAARLVAINLIATMKASAGDLDKVRLIKITGFVQSADGFTSQPQVVNGASNFFLEIFGKDKGAHARSAVGVNALPLGVCVEIEAIVEVEPYSVL